MRRQRFFGGITVRICVVSEAYPPTDGGVATSAQRISRSLSAQGAQVTLCTFDHSRPIESSDYRITEEDQGVQVNRFGPFFLKHPNLSLNEKTKAIFRRRAFDQMTEFLRTQNPDILFSMYLLNAGFVATFVARTLCVPHVAGIRGNDIGRNVFDIERFSVIQWVLSSADRTVAVNHHLLTRQLITFPETAPHAHIIPNSIPPVPAITDDAVTAARARVAATTGWDEESLRIVFVGNLREKKGAQPLAEALDLLRERGIPFRFLLVGQDLAGAILTLVGDRWQRVKDAGLVHATGMLPRRDVAGWVLGCDVVVMPSLDDGMANGLLEGMQQGLCPVASDLFADVVTPDENGLLVRRADPAGLAEALARVAYDRTLLRRLGKAARQGMEAYGPTQEAQAYLNLFADVLKSKFAQS